MRDRIIGERHLDQIFLRSLDGLTDGLGHFFRLSVAVADMPAFISDNHQGAEAQVFAPLHDFRYAVDRHDRVFQLQLPPVNSFRV